jgi:hypothetical protein
VLGSKSAAPIDNRGLLGGMNRAAELCWRRREVLVDRLADLLLAHPEPRIAKPFDQRRRFARLIWSSPLRDLARGHLGLRGCGLPTQDSAMSQRHCKANKQPLEGEPASGGMLYHGTRLTGWLDMINHLV